ncbi:iron complex transport system ATP-binding protein [Kineothrix alysoides]|uniref:Iron complex transport system ATP-binding protein n=1 Tax=Kineothrix alysoides TaxID=1469948 RepID=A0A4R1QUT8_9FIRM|nr:ABC transporter ATP-binding protein [Kineothrix alysoides]TCL56861.1 iron complex transport system ATP-binding protein [Kineothrix alysoides]
MGIEIKNLQAAYEDRIIIPDASLVIPKGKVTMLIGPNGCGKSTLLKSIARTIPAKRGSIYLHGEDIRRMPPKSLAKKMAVLPQSPLVPEGIQVKELVAYGRFPYQKPLSGLKRADHEIIRWAMEKTGVLELEERRVEELSGGQRQRVWISLALAQKTGVLLLDEPTTYLDMAHQLEILELLRKLNHEEKTTIVMVIHELNHASKFADHIIGMKQGHILFEGTPKEVIHVENLRKLYEIEAVLMENKDKGYPICMDYSLICE